MCAGIASSNAQAVDSAAIAEPSAAPSASLSSSSHIALDDPSPLFNENDNATPSWLESGLLGQKNAAEAAAKRQHQATANVQSSSSPAPLSLAEAQAATANATTAGLTTNVTEPQQLGQLSNEPTQRQLCPPLLRSVTDPRCPSCLLLAALFVVFVRPRFGSNSCVRRASSSHPRQYTCACDRIFEHSSQLASPQCSLVPLPQSSHACASCSSMQRSVPVTLL